MNDTLLDRIKKLSNDSGTISLQSFHFINLELVERATGASWLDLREKIFTTTENFLLKRLSHEDLVIKLQNGFLVVFANIIGSQAAILGEQLSDDINRFFVGEEAFKTLQVASKNSTVTATDLFTTISTIKNAALDSTLPAPPDPDDDTPYWRSHILDRLKLFYRPIWDSRNEIISSNSCIPFIESDNHKFYGRDVQLGDNSADFVCALDLSMLSHSQKIFVNNIASRNKYCVITVTVSYRILRDNASRIAYFNQLQQTPERLRKFFYVCVDQIPSGAPQSKLIEIFRSLRPLCGAILIHESPSAIHFDSFKACGITLFGFPLQQFLNQDSTISSNMLDKITFYCAQAQKQKAMTYVTEVENLDHISQLQRAGVQYFSGCCIGQPSVAPMLPSTLQAKNIFPA